MTARRNATPIAFEQAFEMSLRALSVTSAGIARRCQLLVFDSFLERVTQLHSEPVQVAPRLNRV